MSDFEDANVDKDLLDQIFGKGEATEPDLSKDLFADSQTEEENDDGISIDLSDLLADREEDSEKEDMEEESAPEKEDAEEEETLSEEEEEVPLSDDLEEAEDDDKEEAALAEEVEEIDSDEEIEPEKDGGEEVETKMEEKNLETEEFTADDETTLIMKGTTINGGITSTGSLKVMGTIVGDVDCKGKLSVYGTITGNVTATDVEVETDKLEGNIDSEDSVKILKGTRILGDITGSSAVIAGAVKGNIDVDGPVTLDETAVIKGSIKAKQLQVNAGAVIEGMCSLAYADIDIDSIFE